MEWTHAEGWPTMDALSIRNSCAHIPAHTWLPYSNLNHYILLFLLKRINSVNLVGSTYGQSTGNSAYLPFTLEGQVLQDNCCAIQLPLRMPFQSHELGSFLAGLKELLKCVPFFADIGTGIHYLHTLLFL